MGFGTHHVHVKTRDPKRTMQFYVENLGATVIADLGARGYRVNLHGLTLNITGLIDTQHREQHYGIEHIAIDTDELDTLVKKLAEKGIHILEQTVVSGGRRVCFFEGPDGVQLEFIEIKPGA